MQIANDIEESGVDGLMPHLTEEAQEAVSAISSITENKIIKATPHKDEAVEKITKKW